MNCAEFHRAFGANPSATDEALAAHRAACPACERYAQETLRLDGLIRRALEVPVPPARPLPLLRRVQPRWLALAASALLTIGIVTGLVLLGTPRESLATEVVQHMLHESASMTVTGERVSSTLLDGALRAKGLHLAAPLNDVSYLHSCFFRGHFIPHLVVQTDQGPVTVLILTAEPIAKAERFNEDGYSGILLPAPRGSLAVIGNDAVLAERVAKRVRAAIVWE